MKAKQKLARELEEGDTISIRKVGERIIALTRNGSHVYVETDYTRSTGGMAYDFDIMVVFDVKI